MCVMDLGGSWNDHLPLVEFAYNNSYHSNIEMARMKLCMGGSVDPLCVGMRLEKES